MIKVQAIIISQMTQDQSNIRSTPFPARWKLISFNPKSNRIDHFPKSRRRKCKRIWQISNQLIILRGINSFNRILIWKIPNFKTVCNFKINHYNFLISIVLIKLINSLKVKLIISKIMLKDNHKLWIKLEICLITLKIQIKLLWRNTTKIWNIKIKYLENLNLQT